MFNLELADIFSSLFSIACAQWTRTLILVDISFGKGVMIHLSKFIGKEWSRGEETVPVSLQKASSWKHVYEVGTAVRMKWRTSQYILMNVLME